MDIKALYKRLWQAPDGHVYFGWFCSEIPDHLFDVSKFLEVLYSVSEPQEIAGDIDKLVIAYFLEASSQTVRGTEAREMFETAEPVIWSEKKLVSCITYHSDLVLGYKRAMGLPIETLQERYFEHKRKNGEEP